MNYILEVLEFIPGKMTRTYSPTWMLFAYKLPTL
jgi:hypothetical protein